jgi:hypothetical protein
MLILATQYEFTATNAGYGTFSFMLDLPTTTKVSFLCSAIMNLIFSVSIYLITPLDVNLTPNRHTAPIE